MAYPRRGAESPRSQAKAVPIVRPEAIVLWLDEFYWSARQMIVRTMADEQHAHEIDKWIAAGRFTKSSRN
jgi:hypothetical protein